MLVGTSHKYIITVRDLIRYVLSVLDKRKAMRTI